MTTTKIHCAILDGDGKKKRGKKRERWKKRGKKRERRKKRERKKT